MTVRLPLRLSLLLLLLAGAALAQGISPWHTAVTNMQTAFTGPIGRGLGLIAVVISGLAFAFGSPGAKKTLAGVVFGLAMVLGAVQWVAWLGL